MINDHYVPYQRLLILNFFLYFILFLLCIQILNYVLWIVVVENEKLKRTLHSSLHLQHIVVTLVMQCRRRRSVVHADFAQA